MHFKLDNVRVPYGNFRFGNVNVKLFDKLLWNGCIMILDIMLQDNILRSEREGDYSGMKLIQLNIVFDCRVATC